MLPEGLRARILSGPGAACKRHGRGARRLVGAGARGGGRSAGDSHLDGFRRAHLYAGMHAVRRALRARGDCLSGRARSCRGRGEGSGALWRQRQRGLRIKERRVVWRDPWLMSQLLLQAAYTTPLAVILMAQRRSDRHGRGRLHARAGGDRRATRRRSRPGSRSRPRTRRIF